MTIDEFLSQFRSKFSSTTRLVQKVMKVHLNPSPDGVQRRESQADVVEDGAFKTVKLTENYLLDCGCSSVEVLKCGVSGVQICPHCASRCSGCFRSCWISLLRPVEADFFCPECVDKLETNALWNKFSVFFDEWLS